ncbi:MAG: RNA-binding protein [Rubrivivax sp. SCN 71-131]|jgi:putative YhbY family RNA-binding protein|nr:MAG: RNA-binding protein [Rubrivivax sp. SCN 71-131]
MPVLTLTPAERKEMRGLAHHLEPVAMIGAEGLTAAVQREVDAALAAHGLIKVRVFSDDRSLREATLLALAQALGAAPVQHIGKLLVLWRPPAEKSRGERADRKPGPRVVRVVKPSARPGRAPVAQKLEVLGNQRVTAGGLVKRARPTQRSTKKAR